MECQLPVVELLLRGTAYVCHLVLTHWKFTGVSMMTTIIVLILLRKKLSKGMQLLHGGVAPVCSKPDCLSLALAWVRQEKQKAAKSRVLLLIPWWADVIQVTQLILSVPIYRSGMTTASLLPSDVCWRWGDGEIIERTLEYRNSRVSTYHLSITLGEKLPTVTVGIHKWWTGMDAWTFWTPEEMSL